MRPNVDAAPPAPHRPYLRQAWRGEEQGPCHMKGRGGNHVRVVGTECDERLELALGKTWDFSLKS